MWNLHLTSITLVCCLLLNIPIEIISSKWEHLPTCIWHDLNKAHNVYYFTELSPLFTVYFDSTCGEFDTYTIFDDDTFYIKWRGSKLSSSCSYKLSPYDTDDKVCVEAVSYSVNDCNVNLQYYGGIIATLLRRVLFDLIKYQYLFRYMVFVVHKYLYVSVWGVRGDVGGGSGVANQQSKYLQ